MNTRKKSRVSIVIPSYNCKKVLFRLLGSIKNSDYSISSVIVVDNGSTDGTLKEGRKKYSWVKWVDAGKVNIGWGGSYNLGFAHAIKSEPAYILMIDSDVIVEGNMFEKLVERAEKDKKIGIVTPMILYLNDKNWVNQAGAEVDLWTGKVKIGWGPKKDFLKAKEIQNSGTAMLIKRDVFKEIGGFDDWFIGYLDPDLCLRAKKAGYSTWYEPRAIAYHDQSKDKKVWGPRVLTRAYYIGRNRTLFMRRHGKSIIIYFLLIPIFWLYFMSEAIRYGLFRKYFELVRGTIDGFFYPLRKSSYIPLPEI